MKILVPVSWFYAQVSRQFIIYKLFDSWLKFILGWYLLRSFRKNLSFSSPCVQMKNKSSIYLYNTNGRYSCVLRKSVSNLSMKIQAYLCQNLVPIAVFDIFCSTIPLNSKQLFSNTKRAILIRS